MVVLKFTLLLKHTRVVMCYNCIIYDHLCAGNEPSKKKREEIPVFEQAENAENPLRCPVKLYEFYLSKWSVQYTHPIITDLYLLASGRVYQLFYAFMKD